MADYEQGSQGPAPVHWPSLGLHVASTDRCGNHQPSTQPALNAFGGIGLALSSLSSLALRLHDVGTEAACATQSTDVMELTERSDHYF